MRGSDAKVTVRIGDTIVAESAAPMVVSETGLANRWYLPAADVRSDALVESDTVTYCPYKGRSTYWTLRSSGSEAIADVAWSYGDPLDDARRVAGHLSFDGPDVTVEVT